MQTTERRQILEGPALHLSDMGGSADNAKGPVVRPPLPGDSRSAGPLGERDGRVAAARTPPLPNARQAESGRLAWRIATSTRAPTGANAASEVRSSSSCSFA